MRDRGEKVYVEIELRPEPAIGIAYVIAVLDVPLLINPTLQLLNTMEADVWKASHVTLLVVLPSASVSAHTNGRSTFTLDEAIKLKYLGFRGLDTDRVKLGRVVRIGTETD